MFTVGPDGRRPCFGWVGKLQHDPAWKDNLLFNEYFHGDNGAGLGATHQTGWTGLIADVIRRRHGAVPLSATRSAAFPRRPSHDTIYRVPIPRSLLALTASVHRAGVT